MLLIKRKNTNSKTHEMHEAKQAHQSILIFKELETKDQKMRTEFFVNIFFLHSENRKR